MSDPMGVPDMERGLPLTLRFLVIASACGRLHSINVGKVAAQEWLGDIR